MNHANSIAAFNFSMGMLCVRASFSIDGCKGGGAMLLSVMTEDSKVRASGRYSQTR